MPNAANCPNFERLTETALHEGWEGQRLVRLVRLFLRFEQPMPVDLRLHVAEVFPQGAF